jgi:hypothetical protein
MLLGASLLLLRAILRAWLGSGPTVVWFTLGVGFLRGGLSSLKDYNLNL